MNYTAVNLCPQNPNPKPCPKTMAQSACPKDLAQSSCPEAPAPLLGKPLMKSHELI